MKDMDKAVERIRRVVESKERIVIYSDYDVDGITGAAILYKAFKALGAEPAHYVPDRLVEGYGINEDAVVKLAEGYDLIISVDCGVSDSAPIKKAGKLGLDVIVTDHHRVPSVLPPAYAVINPKRDDCSCPFPYLAGVGVAYKLAVAVMGAFGRVGAEDWLELAALGTVADVVPLSGENRILVKEGLKRLQETKNPGICALKKVSKIRENKVGVYEVGYLLAPRLNAASRMGRADLAFTLLTSEDEGRCALIAQELDSLNNKRKGVEQRILEEARALAEGDTQKALVLASDGWHPGVTGIVASKLKEDVYRPVLLVAWDDSNKGKGTARSITGFPVTSALGKCGDLLIGYGGHDAAAGFSIRRECWEDFRKRFLEVAEEEIKEEGLIPKIHLDQEIDLESVNTYNIMAELGKLAPFGVRNPEPVFSARNLSLAGTPREVGANHLKLALRQGRWCYNAIGFGMAEFLGRLAGNGECTVDVAFSLRINAWRGKENIQLHLKDLIIH
jgi:single-stranded-DNA-specific exonuclease